MSAKWSEIFREELDAFNDKRFMTAVENVMAKLPDTILERPASTTGKYHPNDELGSNGMIIHIKRACAMVPDAARKYQFSRYGEDVLRAGCLLHDAFKFGEPPTEHTVTEHPYLIYRELEYGQYMNFGDNPLVLDWLRDVALACAHHEGVWTTELCDGVRVTEFAKALHEIDYWVTRRVMWDVMRKDYNEGTGGM